MRRTSLFVPATAMLLLSATVFTEGKPAEPPKPQDSVIQPI